MPLALVFPGSREEQARLLKERLSRFANIEQFALAAGETVADAFADVRDASLAVFLLDNSSTPRPNRDAWGGILEHLEGNHDPPAAFYFLEPVPVPAVVRRAACLDDPRSLDRWAASHTSIPGHVPAPLPWFEGRDDEIRILRDALLDQPGIIAITGPPLCGKSALAQHFAMLAAPHFQKVEWIAGGRSTASSPIDGRALIVVDDAPERIDIPDSNSSVLITARESRIRAQVRLAALSLPDPPAHPMLPRLALFHRHGFHRLAVGLPLPELKRLVELRCLDPIDAAGDWYRLPWLVSADETARAPWAQAAHRGLLRPAERHAWLPEAFPAFEWAVENDWTLAVGIARRAAAAFEQSGHRPEAAALWKLLELHARRRGDLNLAAEAASAHAWIVNEHTGAYRTFNPGDQLPLFTAADD